MPLTKSQFNKKLKENMEKWIPELIMDWGYIDDDDNENNLITKLTDRVIAFYERNKS